MIKPDSRINRKRSRSSVILYHCLVPVFCHAIWHFRSYLNIFSRRDITKAHHQLGITIPLFFLILFSCNIITVLSVGDTNLFHIPSITKIINNLTVIDRSTKLFRVNRKDPVTFRITGSIHMIIIIFFS